MRIVSTSIFIITMLSAVHILTTLVRAAANNFFRTTIEDDGGTIQSPNFGHEYGMKADYAWRFMMREGKVLKLKLTQLKIFYYDGDNNTQCGHFYGVYINRVMVDCANFINGASGDSPKHNHFYSTPSCYEVECRFGCSRLKVDKGFLEVRYIASGNKPIPSLPASTIWGFRMTYEYLHCTPGEINSTSQSGIPTTTTTTTTATTTPPRTTTETTTTAPTTISSTTATLSTSTTLSTTTTNRATKSNSVTNVASYPIAVGFPPPFETTPHSQSSADVTSAKDENISVESGDALIYGAIGGGIVFVILLVITVFCIVRKKKKTRGNSNAGRHHDDARVSISTTYMNITSNTSQTVYHEVAASPAPQTSQGSFNVSSSATAQVAMTLIETPGYQTVTFNSNQAVGSQPVTHAYDL